jgi:hypothetical protein
LFLCDNSVKLKLIENDKLATIESFSQLRLTRMERTCKFKPETRLHFKALLYGSVIYFLSQCFNGSPLLTSHFTNTLSHTPYILYKRVGLGSSQIQLVQIRFSGFIFWTWTLSELIILYFCSEYVWRVLTLLIMIRHHSVW